MAARPKPHGADDGMPATSKTENAVSPYSVGYARPPVEHRFQKGRSGNPRGRPKGALNKVPTGQGLDFGTQPANQMLLEEAYRTISIREGEHIIELPVIKAVFRSMGVAAMKGNRLAQTTMAELVRGIEEEDRKLRMEHFATALDYKIGWTQAIERARQQGLPEPVPIPHPDDVIIDMGRADVRYAGPMTPEDKARWDNVLEFRGELQEEVSRHAQAYNALARKRTPPEAKMASTAEHWADFTALYDRINDHLPDRYKRRLEDRFYPSLAEVEVTSGEKGQKRRGAGG